MNRAVRNIRPIKGVEPSRLSIIILAAGEANKMRSYGARSLIKVTSHQTLIEYQLDALHKFYQSPEIVLVCGYEAERVMDNTPHEIIKVENERYQDTNVAKSLGVGLRACTGNEVLVMYGDLIFNHDTIKYLDMSSSFVLTDEFGCFDDEEVGCILNEHNAVENMFYALPNKWAQIAFFKGQELKLLKDTVWNKENERWFGFEIINDNITKGGSFSKLSNKKMKILDIDSAKNLQDIKKIL